MVSALPTTGTSASSGGPTGGASGGGQTVKGGRSSDISESSSSSSSGSRHRLPLSSSASSNNPMFVQRGFNLPNFGINPSILSGIPESSSGSPPNMANTNPAFLIPHLKSWQTSGGLGDSDDLTDVLQSLAQAHQAANNLNNKNNTYNPSANNHTHAENSALARFGDIRYNFHGYHPNQQQHNGPLSQSLPQPTFSRYDLSSDHHSSMGQDGSKTPRSPLDFVNGQTANHHQHPAIPPDFFNLIQKTEEPPPPTSSHSNDFSAFSAALGVHTGGSVSAPPSNSGASSADERKRTASPMERGVRRPSSTTGPADQEASADIRGRQMNPSHGKANKPSTSRNRTGRAAYSRTLSPQGAGVGRPASVSVSNPSSSGASHGTSSNGAMIMPAGSPPNNASSTNTNRPFTPAFPRQNSQGQVPYGSSVSNYAGSAKGGVANEGGSWPVRSDSTLSNFTDFSEASYPFSYTSHRRPSDAASTNFAPSSYNGDSPLVGQVNLPDVDEDEDRECTTANGMDVPGSKAGGSMGTGGVTPGSFSSIASSAPAGFGFAQRPASTTTVEGDDGLSAEPTKPSKGRAPVDERRRKRRESHNAVERRRRDNINDRITELAALIPEILLDATPAITTSHSNSGRAGSSGSVEENDANGAGQHTSDSPPLPSGGLNLTPAQLAQQQASNKPNKGVILSKSVEYIRYLQQMVQVQQERNKELETRVKMLESRQKGGNMSNGGTGQHLGMYQNHPNGSSSRRSSSSPGMGLTPLPTVEERMMEESGMGMTSMGNRQHHPQHSMQHHGFGDNGPEDDDGHHITFEDLLGAVTSQSPGDVMEE